MAADSFCPRPSVLPCPPLLNPGEAAFPAVVVDAFEKAVPQGPIDLVEEPDERFRNIGMFQFHTVNPLRHVLCAVRINPATGINLEV